MAEHELATKHFSSFQYIHVCVCVCVCVCVYIYIYIYIYLFFVEVKTLHWDHIIFVAVFKSVSYIRLES